MRKIGYCRVSTREQNLERQIEAMKIQGVERKNIYAEQMSGKDFARPQYKKMMRKLRAGAKAIGMSKTTFYRRCIEREKKDKKSPKYFCSATTDSEWTELNIYF